MTFRLCTPPLFATYTLWRSFWLLNMDNALDLADINLEYGLHLQLDMRYVVYLGSIYITLFLSLPVTYRSKMTKYDDYLNF